MKEQKVREIIDKCKTEWANRFPTANMHPAMLKVLETKLRQSPYEDGCERMIDTTTGRKHIVPFEYIILNGIIGIDLTKFPKETFDETKKEHQAGVMG